MCSQLVLASRSISCRVRGFKEELVFLIFPPTHPGFLRHGFGIARATKEAVA